MTNNSGPCQTEYELRVGIYTYAQFIFSLAIHFVDEGFSQKLAIDVGMYTYVYGTIKGPTVGWPSGKRQLLRLSAPCAL